MLKIIVVGWQLVTLVAIVAMFHLWFTREKTMYWGRDTKAKRIEMFKYIGFPTELLDGTEKVQLLWANNKRHSVSGNFDALSYPTYVLIPRLAVPSSPSSLVLGAQAETLSEEFNILNPSAIPESRIAINDIDSLAENPPLAIEEPPRPHALLSAFLAVAGLGLLLRRLFYREIVLSLPEAFSLGVLVTGVLTMLSKHLFHSLFPGSIFLIGLSLIGWLLFIVKKDRTQNGSETEETSALHKEDDLDRRICIGAYAIILAVFLWSFLKTVTIVPDVWDCWAIWGAKAKMMALGAGPISDVIITGQRDYPLLWPSLWSFTGWLAGGWEEQWSKGWGPILMLIATAEIAFIVRRETVPPG